MFVCVFIMCCLFFPPILGAKSSEDILADSTRSNHDKESFSSSSSTNLLPGNNRRRTGLAYCMSHLYLLYHHLELYHGAGQTQLHVHSILFLCFCSCTGHFSLCFMHIMIPVYAYCFQLHM